jgi:hypothetical protein
MDLQEEMLIGYFLYLNETERDEDEKDRKIIKAVKDYYIQEASRRP